MAVTAPHYISFLQKSPSSSQSVECGYTWLHTHVPEEDQLWKGQHLYALLLYHAWLLERCSDGWCCKPLGTHMVPTGKCHQFLKSFRRMRTSVNNSCPKLRMPQCKPFWVENKCVSCCARLLDAVYWGFWARSYLHHFCLEELYWGKLGKNKNIWYVGDFCLWVYFLICLHLHINAIIKHVLNCCLCKFVLTSL